jgi:fatty-acyl-CoA synthase
VRLRPGGELDAEAVREFCTGRLAHYKVPRYVLVVDEFPMTVTGKIQKFKMRDASIERLGLQTAASTVTA